MSHDNITDTYTYSCACAQIEAALVWRSISRILRSL
jgi:hypothetical protein